MTNAQQFNESLTDPQTESDRNETMVYQIRVKSHLDSNWTDWFDGLTVTPEETGHTLLTGPVVDQAALYGLLKKIRDLGMLLISVNSLEPGAARTLGSDQADAVRDIA